MRGMSKKDALACQVSLGLFAGLLGIASTAHGMPVHDGGGTNHNGVRAGSVTGTEISPGSTTMNIESGSANNVIGWKDFSVKSGETVKFDNGAQTHNYLNIVTGNVTSQIAGTMEGGKNVYIANPHGVVFGDGASVNVGNLYVTTRQLDADSYINNAPDLKDTATSPLIAVSATTKAADTSAAADVVSLIDGSGSLKANKIVLEGRSVRIMNDAAIQSPTSGGTPKVYALSDQREFSIPYGGSYDANTGTITTSTKQKLADHKGYVHIGYAGAEPATDGTGKYKNLAPENMYKLVGSAVGTASVADLNGMTDMNGRYMLRGDVDFGNAEHTPIGTINKPFKGKFDGMFRTISNMKLPAGSNTASTSSSTESYAGLFGNASGAEIMNLGLKEADLSAVIYGGGIVGSAKDNTRISAVYNESSKTIGKPDDALGLNGSVQAGGIVGAIEGSVVDQAYNKAPISKAGGIVGELKTSVLYAVYNTGETAGSGASYGIYRTNGSGSSNLVKDVYTTKGAAVGPDAATNAHAYDSYVFADSSGKKVANLAANLKTANLTSNGGAADQKEGYASWDISDEGGANKTWRIFAGHSNPLLTAFMQGTVQAEYSYADFTRPNKDNKSTYAANTYTDMIAGTLKKNGGESVPKDDRTYDATYRTLTKENGTKIGGISDVTVVGYTAPASTSDPKAIQINTDGRRNAGKEAMLYSGQHGYDVAGANIEIKKRKVVGSWNALTIEKEYDGTTTATTALQNALTADSIRITGVIDGDDATLGMSSTPVVANFNDANAGYGKALTISGNFELTGADAANYSNISAADLTPPASGLKGNIRQKKIVVGLNSAKSYDKTYDGEADVADAINPQKAAGSDVLTLAAKTAPPSSTPDPFTAGVVDLNKSNITAKYMTGKTASDTEARDVKMNGTAVAKRDIAYKNIKLVNGTGDKTNYMLVDAQGNVLYRDEAPGEAAYKAATETATDYSNITNADKKANDRYIGAVTTAGELWSEGKINKRRIDASDFKVTGGNKAYDGTDYLVVNGAARKVQAPDATSGSNTNVITEDKDRLIFTISAADKKAYYKNTPTATANTKDVYAATNINGARYLSYTLKASDTTNGATLANYELDYGGGTTRALNTTDTYNATGAGEITPRTVYVDLLKKDGINKTYDGNATSNATAFGTNFGYTTTAANANKLVHDGGAQPDGTAAPNDGASITATAVYKKSTGPEAGDKDVSHASDGTVIDNGKNVEYTVTLTGTNAATNYVLSYGTATPASSVTMTGTGKITPKKLTLTSTSPVTRGYNGGWEAPASLLDGKHTLDGKISSDTVALNTGTGTTIAGTYYKDTTKAEKAVNRGTGYTVAYTGISTALTGADSGNYEIDDAFDVLGDITKMVLTKDNLKILLKSKVTKTYDANERAEADGLQKLTVDGTELKPGIGYEIERANSVYYNKTPANTGNFMAPNANAQEDDGATLHAGAAAYGVRYKIKLLGDAAGNYELGDWHDGDAATTGKYTVAGNRITFERDGVGYIQSRKMYVSLSGNAKNPEMTTKPYDGTTKLILQGATSGDPFLSLGNGGQKNAGFATTNNGVYDASNISTGAYQNRNAGAADDKVLYTPKVTGVQTNYVFYHAPDGGSTYAGQKWDAVHAPLTGKGTITQADLLVTTPTDVRRQYNGDTNVDAVQGKLILATQKKHESAPGADDANSSTGVLDDVQLNEIDPSKDGTGAGLSDKYYRHYNAADVNVDAAAQDQAKYVTYRRIKLTGTDAGNYRLVYAVGGGKKPLDKDADYAGYYTMTGKGIIEKRKVNKDDFRFVFAGVKKVYDGDTPVKYDNDSTKAANYITKVAVDLGGTIGEKSLGYTLVEANYLDKNVAANSGTGNVTYKLKLNDDLLKNYDFADLDNAAGRLAGYSYDSANNTITRKLGVGTITKRPVYAHVVNDNVTKTYNAKKDVVDESGAALTGEQLVKFDNVKNGVAQAEAGLIKKDNLGNDTTASYTEKKVGDKDRTIKYTLALSGALINNYELQDENGVAAATLTTHTNTINRRALKLKADLVTKDYDATKIVKVKVGNSVTPSTMGVGLAFVGGDLQTDESNAQDVVNLGTAYTREYNSPNATRTEEAKKNNVTYSGIKLVAGGDAANYFLADADGMALTGNDTAGYTMLGNGVINPLTVKKSNLKMTFRTAPISKTYDGTAYVDGDTENPAAWKTYITDSYVTDDSNNRLFNIAIDKVNSATYRTGVAAGSDGTADKNAADGKKVLFNLKFSDADRNNFDFDPSFYNESAAGTDRMVHDAATNTDTYNVYTTGDIKKKDLHVEADGYVRKVYDKTANVSDIDKYLKLRDADIVKVDGKKDDVSLTGSSGVFKQGGNSVFNANIAPADGNASGYDVAYTVQTAGADRGNYNFIRSDNNAALADGDTIDNAKGDIEKRKIYAKVVNEPFSKMYDGTGDVKDSDGNPIKGEELVRFGNKKADGTEIANSGYLGDPADNATTAVYDGPNFDVGSDKNMTYTLAFTNAAMGSNYVFYDAKTGHPVTASQLHTQNNIINPAILNLITTGDPEKYYDGNRNVLQPQRYLKLVTASGGNAGISLTYTALYDNKKASRVKPDGTLERKTVSYTDITLGMGGQSAKNYTIRYGGKELEPQDGRYNIDGQGTIKKRLIEHDADLRMDFTGAKVQKTYDGTPDVPEHVKNNLGAYVRGPLRVSYDDNGPQSIDMDSDLAKVLDAAYADKNVKRDAAGNVQGDKDVNFKFTLDGDNFDLSNLDQTKLQRGEETLDADGYRHYKYTYTRAAQNGQIDPRKVNLTVASVRKIYDGTANIGSNYYDADGNEKTDADFDVKNVIKYEEKNGDRGLLDGVGINSADLNGQYIDSNEALPSNDARDANRNIGGRFAAAKKVAYTIHLTGDDADNYAFVGSAMEANPLDGGRKTRIIGEGDIYQKKLSTEVRDTDRMYDGTTGAEAVQSHRSNVTLKTGVAGEDFQLDETAGGLLTAEYGDYDRNKGNFNPNANVKRNADGGVMARDVEYSNLKNALEDIKNRDAAVKAKAKNYFIEDRAYGKGTISPQHVTDVKEIWNGASFDKEYDRSKSAFMPESEKNRKFKDKLQLQLELNKKGGGKEVVSLDYDMYETGDKAPQYDTKNVARKADGSVADDKDVIYTLRGRRSLKDLVTDGVAVNYDYEALNPYFYDGKDVHLKDDKNPNPTVKAQITPRKVVAEPGYVTKVYDQTVNVPADKVKITPDKRSGELMAEDGVGIKVDDAKFLDKNATADPGKAKEATAGKQVQYKLSLSNDGGNYSFTNGTTATEVEGKGDIVRRKVHVEFDGRKDTPDKIYDTTDNVRNADGTQFVQKFRLKNDVADPHGDSGIFADEKAALDGAFTRREYDGHFASSNVRRNPDGSIARQDAIYQGFGLRPDAIGNNYYIVESQDGYRDQNAAKVTPRPIDVYIKDGNMRRQYDGTTNLEDKFQAENNIVLMDRNPEIAGLAKPALPAWNAGDRAAYDSKDAGNRTVSYNPSWQDGNFVLQKGLKSANPSDPTSSLAEVRSLAYDAVAEDGTPLARDGVYGMRIAADGEISKRRLAVGTNDAWKVYDGTTGVNHAWNNLNFANVDEHGNGTGEGAFASESEEQRAKNSLRASYDDAEATEADTPAGALKRHNVNYRFEGADDVMGNYEFVNGTPAGGYSVDGAGFIKRRTLDVLPDWQAAYAGKGGVNYTGRIADGSVQTNEGSPLTPAVAADLQRFNSGVFTYGPMSGSADYSQPNWQEIQGWYTKDGVRTLARGDYERNYTLNPVPSRLFVAPRTDGVDRTLRPDGQVYVRASHDEKDTFGAHRGPDASITYTGAGVNYGGTKPSQGTSTNVSDVGIRQQGIGTNIGSSAGIGGAAVANGKVQGATGAANEAARAAGAQPGADVKPQGAQSGAAVKPQGTTGGNAALAGGTAGQGGYYRPSAQPGASVKPQGAQSGAAVKPQGTTSGNAALAGGTAGQGGYYRPSAQQGASVKPQGAQSGAAAKPQSAASAVGSAGRTGGAGSVVDSGLAAAAGVSVGSSSDARTGASGSRRSADYSSGAGSYADGSSRAADRGLANALGKGVGSAGYYSGKGYSHTDDDEEEEIKKKTKASA